MMGGKPYDAQNLALPRKDYEMLHRAVVDAVSGGGFARVVRSSYTMYSLKEPGNATCKEPGNATCCIRVFFYPDNFVVEFADRAALYVRAEIG
jgi:hypothetical protein